MEPTVPRRTVEHDFHRCEAVGVWNASNRSRRALHYHKGFERPLDSEGHALIPARVSELRVVAVVILNGSGVVTDHLIIYLPSCTLFIALV